MMGSYAAQEDLFQASSNMRRVFRTTESLRRANRCAVAELALYLLLAAASTWPLVRECRSSLPLGTERAATVPLFNTWTVWWNADRVGHLYRGYWDAPIFCPTKDSFAFSEPMPTTVAVAPVIWLTGNRVLAYNVFLIAALTLNGWSAFLLLQRLRLGWLVSAIGGAMVELLPLVHGELGVLQLVPLAGILWTIHAVYLFGRRPGTMRAVFLGAAFGGTYLTCAYYGLFLSVLLIPAGGWLVAKRLRRRRTWLTLPVAAIVSVLLAGPVVSVQHRVSRAHGLRRPPDLVSRLSAEPSEYLASPWPSRLEPAALRKLREQADFRLCPGLVNLALALVGAVGGLRCRRGRSWTAFCLTLLACAFVLSLGPDFRLAGWSPYVLLMDWYPGFGQVRNAFRFAVFAQLAVVFLAALGLRTIAVLGRRVGGEASDQLGTRRFRLQRCPAAGACGVRRHIAPATATLLGILALVEILPPSQRLFPVTAAETQPGWITWLTTQTPEDCVIACLPFPQGTSETAYQETALWMYWGTFHHRRMVNGYSGFFPQSFLATKVDHGHFSQCRIRTPPAAAECLVLHRPP